MFKTNICPNCNASFVPGKSKIFCDVCLKNLNEKSNPGFFYLDYPDLDYERDSNTNSQDTSDSSPNRSTTTEQPQIRKKTKETSNYLSKTKKVS